MRACHPFDAPLTINLDTVEHNDAGTGTVSANLATFAFPGLTFSDKISGFEDVIGGFNGDIIYGSTAGNLILGDSAAIGYSGSPATIRCPVRRTTIRFLVVRATIRFLAASTTIRSRAGLDGTS